MLGSATRRLSLVVAIAGCGAVHSQPQSAPTGPGQLSVFVFNYTGSAQPLRIMIDGQVVLDEKIGHTARHGLVNTVQVQVPLRRLSVHVVDVRAHKVYRTTIRTRAEPQFCRVEVLAARLRLQCAHGMLALM